MTKRKITDMVPDKGTRKAYVRLAPVVVPLLEMFSVVDDVFDEADAFAPEKIHKSLGRIYRQWMDTREALDPGFDRERYRHDIKGRSKKKTSPLGREPLVAGSPTTSTDPRSISEKSQKKSAKPESKSANPSVQSAPSGDPASGGQSKKKSRSGSGEASLKENVSGSENGSKHRATAKSPKKKD